jgi:hypothetical protein
VAAQQAFYRDYVNPFFRAQGFVRAGRTYRRFAPNGDAVVVNFQGSVGSWDERYEYFINVGAHPRPWQERLADGNGGPIRGEPSGHRGMYHRRILGTCYVTDEAGLPAAWQRIEEPLANEVGFLVWLLDRDNFIAFVEGGGRPVYPSHETALSILRTDSFDVMR